MDGIDEILQAEKEADRIRREARAEAEAILGSAEGYRQRTLDTARREGEEEMQRMLDNAVKRAEARKAELRAVAGVKHEEMRREAEKRLADAAGKIAERIAEV